MRINEHKYKKYKYRDIYIHRCALILIIIKSSENLGSTRRKTRPPTKRNFRRDLHKGLHKGSYKGLHKGPHKESHKGLHKGLHKSFHNGLHKELHKELHTELHRGLHKSVVCAITLDEVNFVMIDCGSPTHAVKTCGGFSGEFCGGFCGELLRAVWTQTSAPKTGLTR
jgi:hypothetical protein